MSIIDNRKAFFDYFIEDRYEAGLVLEGWEVKAIRAGRTQIKEGYVMIRDGELYLIGAHISPLPEASTHITPDPVRTRKLLLHSEEISKLIGKVEQRGYTLVPLEPSLQGRPREMRNRPRQGQEDARQARNRKETRLGTRKGAHHARRDEVTIALAMKTGR